MAGAKAAVAATRLSGLGPGRRRPYGHLYLIDAQISMCRLGYTRMYLHSTRRYTRAARRVALLRVRLAPWHRRRRGAQ